MSLGPERTHRHVGAPSYVGATLAALVLVTCFAGMSAAEIGIHQTPLQVDANGWPSPRSVGKASQPADPDTHGCRECATAFTFVLNSLNVKSADASTPAR